METRVTYRASEETVKRLQELAEKYGISQSALLSLLVNDRWLLEQGRFGGVPMRERGEAPNLPMGSDQVSQIETGGKRKRKRKRS